MAWNQKAERIAELEQTCADLTQQIAGLQGELAIERTVDEVSRLAREAIAHPEFQSAVGEDAIALAGIEVVAAERKRLTDDLAERLKNDEYDRLAAEFRQTEGPGILESLRTLFAEDGTFDAIREKAEADVRAQLQDEVLTKLRNATDRELSTPEEEARVKSQLREQLADSGEIQQYRTRVRSANEDAWMAQVNDQVIAEVDAEEAAREEEFKRDYADRVRESDAIQKRRHKVRSKLEQEWADATEQDVSAAIDDEELQDLLRQRAAQIKEAARREEQAKALNEEFTASGIDVSKIPVDARLIIFLGEDAVFNLESKVQDRYGDWKKTVVATPGIQCMRKLTLTAIGEGKFIVDGDSLLEVDDVYAANDALHRGTIITVGRRVKDGSNHRLEQKLTANVPLYYCLDTETGTLVDSLLPVANVEIDGVSARDIKHIEMVE